MGGERKTAIWKWWQQLKTWAISAHKEVCYNRHGNDLQSFQIWLINICDIIFRILRAVTCCVVYSGCLHSILRMLHLKGMNWSGHIWHRFILSLFWIDVGLLTFIFAGVSNEIQFYLIETTTLNRNSKVSFFFQFEPNEHAIVIKSSFSFKTVPVVKFKCNWIQYTTTNGEHNCLGEQIQNINKEISRRNNPKKIQHKKTSMQ